MKEFKTPEFAGAWFDHEGDRMGFRKQLEQYLRTQLDDNQGTLNVDETGPHWVGHTKIDLSYSHTEGKALLIYSLSHSVGVDIEKENRTFSHPPLELASRFFHASDVAELKRVPAPDLKKAFLQLWVKKEAFAKWSRRGISQTLKEKLPDASVCKVIAVPVTPMGYLGAIAVHQN